MQDINLKLKLINEKVEKLLLERNDLISKLNEQSVYIQKINTERNNIKLELEEAKQKNVEIDKEEINNIILEIDSCLALLDKNN